MFFAVSVAALCGSCWTVRTTRFVRGGTVWAGRRTGVFGCGCVESGCVWSGCMGRCVVWCVVTSWGVVLARNEVYRSDVGIAGRRQYQRAWPHVLLHDL